MWNQNQTYKDLPKLHAACGHKEKCYDYPINKAFQDHGEVQTGLTLPATMWSYLVILIGGFPL